MQKWEQAMQAYQQLKDLDPKSVIAAWAALKIAECQLGDNRIEDAIQTYSGVTQEYPGTDWYAEARMGLGVAYEKKKDYDAALEHYQYIVQHYGGGFLAAEALVNMGQCFLQKGNEAKAKLLYEQVVAEYPEAMSDDAKNRLEALKQGKTDGQSGPWGN
jgi:TolA-binding protein